MSLVEGDVDHHDGVGEVSVLFLAMALVVDEPRWFGFEQDLAQNGADEFKVDAVDLAPTATVVGGVGYDHVVVNPHLDDQRQDRVTTLALARTGLIAGLGKHLALKSEIEFNAGPDGTSVWEGQAALQLDDQYVRLQLNDVIYSDRITFDFGRITDPASLNYFSQVTADQLLTDEIARLPLLMAGFNRGQGVRLAYTSFDLVTAAINFNAGNPTSNTGTLMIGGTFPPFARFYEVPFASVGKDASKFPDNNFHVMLLAPSISFDSHWIRAQTELQMIHADTNMSSAKDQPLEGFNVRGGVSATLLEHLGWDNKLVVFANGSRIENDVVKADDLAKLRGQRYEAYTASTGVDISLWGKSGIGAEVAVIREREPGRPPVLWELANAGAVWWLNDVLALGVRGAYEQRCDDLDCGVDGQRELFVTAKLVLDGSKHRKGDCQ